MINLPMTPKRYLPDPHEAAQQEAAGARLWAGDGRRPACAFSDPGFGVLVARVVALRTFQGYTDAAQSLKWEIGAALGYNGAEIARMKPAFLDSDMFPKYPRWMAEAGL